MGGLQKIFLTLFFFIFIVKLVFDLYTLFKEGKQDFLFKPRKSSVLFEKSSTNQPYFIVDLVCDLFYFIRFANKDYSCVFFFFFLTIFLSPLALFFFFFYVIYLILLFFYITLNLLFGIDFVLNLSTYSNGNSILKNLFLSPYY